MNTAQPQNRKAAHNARVRDRILDAAAVIFRQHGYAGAGIDRVMAAADLTRGGFYAHFKSKEALFAAVLQDRHPFLMRLRALADADSAALKAEFADYLAPAHLAEIAAGCTLIALSGDAARQPDAARLGFGGARQAILAEMARVAGGARAEHDAALSCATGALQAAVADADPVRQADILTAAHVVVDQLLSRQG